MTTANTDLLPTREAVPDDTDDRRDSLGPSVPGAFPVGEDTQTKSSPHTTQTIFEEVSFAALLNMVKLGGEDNKDAGTEQRRLKTDSKTTGFAAPPSLASPTENTSSMSYTSQASVLLMVPTNTPSTSTTGMTATPNLGEPQTNTSRPSQSPARHRHVHHVRDGRNKLGVCVARAHIEPNLLATSTVSPFTPIPPVNLKKARLLRLGGRVAGARLPAGCVGGAGKKVVPASATEVEQTKNPVRPRRAPVHLDSTAIDDDAENERRTDKTHAPVSHSHATRTPVWEAEAVVRLPHIVVFDAAAEDVQSKPDGMALGRTRRSSGVYPLSAMKQTPMDGNGDASVLDVEGEGGPGEHATPSMPACNSKQDDEGGDRKDVVKGRDDAVDAAPASGFLHGKGSRLVQKVKEKMHLGSGAGMHLDGNGLTRSKGNSRRAQQDMGLSVHFLRLDDGQSMSLERERVVVEASDGESATGLGMGLWAGAAIPAPDDDDGQQRRRSQLKPAQLQAPTSDVEMDASPPGNTTSPSRSPVTVPMRVSPSPGPMQEESSNNGEDEGSDLPMENGRGALDPEEWTVTTHPQYNLRAFDVVVNKHLHLLICLTCRRALDLKTGQTHIRQHYARRRVPDGMVKNLQIQSTCALPTKFRIPVIPRLRSGVLTCPSTTCGSAAGATADTARGRRCVAILRFAFGGPCAVVFRGRCVELPPPPSQAVPAADVLFRRNFAGFHELVEENASAPADMMELTTFARRDLWYDLVEGIQGGDIVESARIPDIKDEGFEGRLRDASIKYIADVQPMLRAYASFGFRKLMGQHGPDPSVHGFEPLGSKQTCEKYGVFASRLLLAVMRQHRGLEIPFKYPLTAHTEDLHPVVNEVFQRLFMDIATGVQKSPFFNAVICFTVLSSFNDDRTLLPASQITSQLAQLKYLGRAAMLFRINGILTRNPQMEPIEAYQQVQQYLQDSHVSPMAYIYNIYGILKVIRSDEHNTHDAEWDDETADTLIWNGCRIHIPDLGILHATYLDAYRKVVAEDIFFGREPPPEFHASTLDIGSLVDRSKNKSAGFSLLDYSKNPRLIELGNSYLPWLLSHPDLATRFVRVEGKQLVWRPAPCLQLLEDLDRANNLLIVALCIGTPLCARATEISRLTCRNLPGSSLRGFLRLMRNLILLFAIDKTTHRTGKERFCPVAPPVADQQELLLNLAAYRPAQVYLAQIFLGDDGAAPLLGEATEEHLHCRLTQAGLRKLYVSVMSRYGDPLSFELSKAYYFDIIGNHSGDVSNARYNLGNDTDKTGISGDTPIRLSEIGDVMRQEDEEASVLAPGTSSAPDGIDIQTLADLLAAKLQPRLSHGIHSDISRFGLDLHSRLFPPAAPRLMRSELQDVSNIIPHPSRLLDLRRMLNSETADFTSREQSILWEKLANWDTNLLVAMRCGSQKSLTNILTAKCYANGRTTIIILPVSGLHHGLQTSLVNLDVRHGKFDPNGDFDHDAAVVWATVEQVADPRFTKYADHKAATKTLRGVVLDEAHKVATDGDYRPVMQLLDVLARYGVPVAYLTATAPPHECKKLLTQLGIPSADFIRQSVCRENITIGIERHPSKEERFEAFVAMVHTVLEEKQVEEKILVFAQTVDLAHRLAAPRASSSTSDNVTSYDLYGTPPSPTANRGKGAMGPPPLPLAQTPSRQSTPLFSNALATNGPAQRSANAPTKFSFAAPTGTTQSRISTRQTPVVTPRGVNPFLRPKPLADPVAAPPPPPSSSRPSSSSRPHGVSSSSKAPANGSSAAAVGKHRSRAAEGRRCCQQNDDCPSCLGRWYDYNHKPEDCAGDVGTPKDTEWRQKRKDMFNFASGLCFGCLCPQSTREGKGWHPLLNGQQVRNCPDIDIIKCAFYGFIKGGNPEGPKAIDLSFIPTRILTDPDPEHINIGHWAAKSGSRDGTSATFTPCSSGSGGQSGWITKTRAAFPLKEDNDIERLLALRAQATPSAPPHSVVDLAGTDRLVASNGDFLRRAGHTTVNTDTVPHAQYLLDDPILAVVSAADQRLGVVALWILAATVGLMKNKHD
ncbi:hypothetical protein HMN09_00214000 [Mycena chlorophos]|uniref:Helicase ATP-binding domain-containing protein n=1 Tax=Mycena chlorophos TaxID=658473 RepID=A0A8H6WQW6_MYCCL|nr:hypothetical protein HMN09_00214000 [Mycena chlorophos]